MLNTIAVVLLVLGLVGLVSGTIAGGWAYGLIILAAALLLSNLISQERA